MKLLIAIPTYNMYIHGNLFNSLLHFISYCCDKEIYFEIKYRSGSLINRIRNEFITDFISGDFTDLLFIDADLFNFENVLIEMVESKKKLIGGTYIKKQDKEDYNINLCNSINDTLNKKNNVVEVKHIATGLMLINMEVIQKLIEHYPEKKYLNELSIPHYNFFDSYIKDGKYLSEDYGFCEYYKEIGGKVYAYIDGKITHNGQANYSGNFKTFLKKKMCDKVI